MVIVVFLHIALSVHPTRAASAGVIEAAVAEAAGIWAPYSIAIDAAASDGCSRDTDVPADEDRRVLSLVPIVMRRSAVAPGWHGALGAIAFSPEGVPAPVITVFLSDIEQFIDVAHLDGLPQSLWPAAMRQQILGRVLGRVIAHEIGHYVLRSPQHAADGLMRAMQLPTDLVAESRRRFMLTAADAARLEIR